LNDSLLPRCTSRLLLRRFADADLLPFQAYRRDPEVGRYQGWSALDNNAAAAFIANMATATFAVPGEWFQIAVSDRSTDRLVGDIGICLRDDVARTAEIGFSVAPAAQRRGLGTEAVSAALALLFELEAVDRIEGITDARNTPSIRLLERVGMRLDGTREALFNGETCTEYLYSLERATWRELSAMQTYQ
jgi:RimJ/RimL family protein N-acetyltransferase